MYLPNPSLQTFFLAKVPLKIVFQHFGLILYANRIGILSIGGSAHGCSAHASLYSFKSMLLPSLMKRLIIECEVHTSRRPVFH